MNIVVAALITRTDATAFKVDQSSEKEADLYLLEQDGLRHCRQQARKVQANFERDEEHINQDLLEEGFHWREHPQPAEICGVKPIVSAGND